MKFGNIFYFKKICSIGGTEQFLYEIAKKYNDYDIVIFYDKADSQQLQRLQQFVNCKKRKKGETIQCSRAFFNFNIDMIDDVDADEYIFISHAIYQELGYKPPIEHPKLNRFIGVSKYSCEKLEEYGKKIGKKIKAELCYNPLTLEPKEKVIHLVSASRLNDKTKGGQRILELIDALDRYCAKTGRHYIWHIFSKDYGQNIESPNVCVMKPRVDVRPYIADSDYVIQLSNDMETYCYTINEALSYGVNIVTTPLSILEELPIKNTIQLKYDCSNIDEVAEEIFTRKIEKIDYVAPQDNWGDFIKKVKSQYKEEIDTMYEVRAIKNFTDVVENCKRKENEIFFCNKERMEFLLKNNAIEVISEPKKKRTKKSV